MGGAIFVFKMYRAMGKQNTGNFEVSRKKSFTCSNHVLQVPG